MADGYTAIQSLIARLRTLGESPEEIAADIAPALREELEGNIAASRGPDGTAWKPTQAGNPPLAGAAKGLDVAAKGETVTATLSGVEAGHHYGRVRGGVARPILPGSKLPPQIVDLVTGVATKRFRLIMGGA